MVSVYKGKGDALECGSYRGIKLLDQVMKVFERVLETRIRRRVKIDDMQFGFSPGKGTTDAIFLIRQIQEKYLAKKRELWIAFIDLEKAFDRVPRDVLWWALRCVGMEEKGLRVNMGKTKVMKCQVRAGQAENSGKWPCGVCRKGVGRNSILCRSCNKWNHKKCSGVTGRLKDVSVFKCSKCIEGVQDVADELGCVMLRQFGRLECVDKFCYLGDMIGAGGGAEEASRTRVRCAWGKFRQLLPILTMRGASLKLKGKIYRSCVQSVLVYGSETWPMKLEDMHRLERNERMMVRWMCGVTLKDKRSCATLLSRLGIDCVEEIVRRGRLRWFGHLERKNDDEWVKKCRNLKVEGEKCRGRGKKTWDDSLTEDMRKLCLRREDAQNRGVWRSVISGNRLTRASTEKGT